MRFAPHIILAASLFGTSCNNDDVRAIDADEAGYAHFSITGEEGKDYVTCLLQFFDSDTAGKGIALQPPGRLLLDGEQLSADSAGFSGVYYEVQKPLENFAGHHTLKWANASGKQYSESFDFVPFQLETEMGAQVKKEGLNLQLQGLKGVDSLNILLADTSFSSMDIDRVQLVKGGLLQLTKKDFENVATGPVTLYLVKEEERPVKSGGKITISYSIIREFDVVH